MRPALAQALVPSEQEEADAHIREILIGEDGMCSAMSTPASDQTQQQMLKAWLLLHAV